LSEHPDEVYAYTEYRWIDEQRWLTAWENGELVPQAVREEIEASRESRINHALRITIKN
jgi:hypothetical protein